MGKEVRHHKVTAIPVGPWNPNDIYFLLVVDRVERWIVDENGLTIKKESPLKEGDNISLLANDLLFIPEAPIDTNPYIRKDGSWDIMPSVSWGDIIGTLSNQTDLQSALNDLQSSIDALDSVVILKGVWDASVGTFPGLGLAQSGFSYIVSVGGTVDGISFKVNDRIIAITDDASTTVFSGNWFKADYTDEVISVAGKVGAVVLDSNDITDIQSAISNNTQVLGNTAKVGVTTEEPNTIDSAIAGEPTGSIVIPNIVFISQAEYDAAVIAETTISTTLYVTPE